MRVPLWTKLVELVSKHRKFAGAKWALDSKMIDKVDKIAESLVPRKAMNLHRRLFSERDFDLYEEDDNWEEQRKKLEERRQKAIQEILDSEGLESLIEFANSVDSPWRVGLSLGFVAKKNSDTEILPKLLDTENSKLAQFANGFVLGKNQSLGWKWVDQINTSGWTPEQIGQFLVYLPFSQNTWTRSSQLLGQNEDVYWRKADVNPYQAEGDLDFAIDKLLEHDRPHAAISCINRMLRDKQPVDNVRTVKALLKAISSAEPAHSMDIYNIIDIIKKLQDDPNTNPDDLFKVEWAYLPFLDRHRGASPKLLEKRLASEPDFFCEVIRLIFRSKNTEKPVEEPTEQQKNIATNAYRLLREWKRPPGIKNEGIFDGDVFDNWLKKVKAICEESGHLDVALVKIGNVLTHTPPDSDGLWIHHSVADALNDKDADEIRSGFSTGIFNSRGCHFVDPTGKPEKNLAAKYEKQAEEVEAHGYQRLATTLRTLSESYLRDAERIIEDHKISEENEE